MIDSKVIITTDVARISVEYAEKRSISVDEAMQEFLGSATYMALIDTETGLCYEMWTSSTLPVPLAS